MAQLPSNKIMQIMQARSNGYKKICVCVGGWGLEGGGYFDKQTKFVCVGGGGSVVS